MVLNIMVSVSQWEREAIGERTRDAMRHKRANSERVGTVPFGYRLAQDGLHLEAEPGEQALVDQVRAMKAAGCTFRSITAELNRQGFTTRRGTAWRFQYVAQVVRAAMPECSGTCQRPDATVDSSDQPASRHDDMP